MHLHTAQFTLSGNAVLFTQPNKKIRLKGQKTNKISFLIAKSQMKTITLVVESKTK